MKLDFSNYFVKNVLEHSFSDICNCRMAAYIAQNCRCYITGKHLLPKERELHHITPISRGGLDTIDNTIILDRNVHRLIHCSSTTEIANLLRKLRPTHKQFMMINQYRYEAYQSILNNSMLEQSAA
jgi:hypothetical protein